MNLIRRIFRSKPAAQTQATPRRGGSLDLLTPTGAGTARGSLAIATAYRCISIISQSVASLPLRVMNRRGSIYTPESGSPLAWALAYEPNPETTAFDLWQSAVQHMLLYGNAYILPTFADGMATLRLCSPGAVAYDANTDTYDISDILQGIHGHYTADRIIHLRHMTLDGKTGIGVIAYARQSLEIAAKGATEQERRFANGGIARGMISNVDARAAWGENSPEQLGDTAEYMNERIAAGDIVIAKPGDGGFTPFTMTSADMQFLESRKFEGREICRFFGVHPSFVFDDTSNNYKSAESANSAFLTNTLNPILRKIETELTRKLFPMKARYGDCRVEFDRPALFAMDLEARYRHQRSRLEMGTATVNELRREDNLPPLDGGDIPVISANLRAITDLDSYQQPTPSNPDNNAAD